MCVQSSVSESLKLKNWELDQYISGEKVWVEGCDCDEEYTTSGLNNTQHNTKQKGATSAEYVSYINQDLSLHSRLQTMVFQVRK